MADKNYVNNELFLSEIKKYREKVKLYKSEGKEIPRIPDYIGLCILDIATNLARRPNFNGYTYKDEMIGDGYEHCIRYFHNFDPDKSNNPFAYFTKIAYYAFIRRITSEKKHVAIKSKLIINSGIFDSLISQQDGDSSNYDEVIKEILKDYIDNSILEKEDDKKEDVKHAREEKQKGIDKFFDSNGEEI